MNRLHRFLASMVPEPRRQWVAAHAAELDQLEGRRRLAWWLGVLPVTVFALAAQLRHDPHSFRGGTLMKVVVTTLSILNLVAGVALIAIWAFDAGHPASALGLGAALAAQGCLGIATEANTLRRSHRASVVLLAASTIALVMGVAAFSIGFARNVNPATADPEFGPMIMTLLIAAHGAATILGRTTSAD